MLCPLFLPTFLVLAHLRNFCRDRGKKRDNLYQKPFNIEVYYTKTNKQQGLFTVIEWNFSADLSKVCPIENNTNLNSIFCLMKSSRIDFYFFTCILPDYVAHETTKLF